MKDNEVLQRCVEYIENNLKAEIKIKEISDYAGFSVSYFSEMFQRTIGVPVMTFITKRRLLHAVYAIQSHKPTEAAFEFGFNTYSGFYKAFKKEFGCSPKKYLKICKVEEPSPFNIRRDGINHITITEIKRILKNWNISEIEVKSVKLLGGKINALNVWNISDRFILKTGTDFSALKRNISISKECRKQGLQAGIPVLTKDGFEFFQQNERYFYLAEKIQGSALSMNERADCGSSKFSYEYGKAIGKLHLALEKVQPNIEILEVNLFSQVKNWALPIVKRSMAQWEIDLPETFYKEYIQDFEPIYNQLPCQIIHRDTNPDNILFYNGLVSGFVDFDLVQKSIRLFDPCYCATALLSEVGQIQDSSTKWTQFLEGILKGYDDTVTLTELERKAVPYVIYSIQMICVAYFSEKDEYRELADRNRKLLKWIWENRDQCFKEFV